MPQTPRLAHDDDGGPAFDFIWYRAPAGAGPAPDAGGLVTLTLELGPSAQECSALAAMVRAPLPAVGAPEVVPVPFIDGTVELTVGGESNGGEFAKSVGGGGLPLTGSERSTFAVKLTRDGAALLADSIEAGRDLFLAKYDLVYEQRLDAVSLRVWCDGRRAHDLAAGLGAAGADVPRSAALLTSGPAAGTDLLTQRPIAEWERSTLMEVGRRVLEAAPRPYGG